jgi:hypothetical protein
MTNAPPITRRSAFLALPAFALFFQLMSGTGVQAQSSPTDPVHLTCQFVCQGSRGSPYYDTCMRDCGRNYGAEDVTPRIPNPATTPYTPDPPPVERGSTPDPDDERSR